MGESHVAVYRGVFEGGGLGAALTSNRKDSSSVGLQTKEKDSIEPGSLTWARRCGGNASFRPQHVFSTSSTSSATFGRFLLWWESIGTRGEITHVGERRNMILQNFLH